MKRTLFKASAAAGAAALLLTACDSGGSADDDASGDSASQDPVYAEMASWDACEVLNDLQPITEYMDIKGYGSLTSEGGEPGSSKLGNTFDPDAMGCGNLIYLGRSEGFTSGGELYVSFVPTESEDAATALYAERVAGAESTGSDGQKLTETIVSEPWDEGLLRSWLGDSEAPHLELVARDGQWIIHITLEHDKDLGLQNTGTPSYTFTTEDLCQWLVETYLPEVNQIVNDRIAEVQ
jgi:hypothetical protein